MRTAQKTLKMNSGPSRAQQHFFQHILLGTGFCCGDKISIWTETSYLFVSFIYLMI